MKIRDIVLDGKHAPDYSVVYIVSNEKDEVVYVGKSFEAEDRLYAHFAPTTMYPCAFSDGAKINLPASLEWTVDFVCHPEEMKYPERWARDKEYELIQLYWPKYNIHGVREEQGEYKV